MMKVVININIKMAAKIENKIKTTYVNWNKSKLRLMSKKFIISLFIHLVF